MIDREGLRRAMTGTPLERWLPDAERRTTEALADDRDSRLPQWRVLLEALPRVAPSSVDWNAGCVRAGMPQDCPEPVRREMEGLLRGLHPWRKGPYDLFGIHIDTEWRSDWKWDRLCDYIDPLEGRLVLDVGCGNGYHCWRMAGAGARLVIGIDPYLIFVIQFLAVRRYMGEADVFVLPLGIEDVPPDLRAFDTVFSMGVFHHRRSPMDHLLELKSFLRPGGQLVLETLVIEGEEGRVLVPPGRYAKMRNVWFLPSPPTLEAWMRRCGLGDVRLVDVSPTTTEEQRATDWMTFESLSDYLNPADPTLTVEGLPAPRRAIFLARCP